MGITEIISNIRFLMLPVIIIIGVEFLLIALYYFYRRRQLDKKTNPYKEAYSWCNLRWVYCFCVGANDYWPWHFPLHANESSTIQWLY